MIKCPFDNCKSREVTVLCYRERYRENKLSCLTYECICRDCERRFAISMNLEA